MEGVRLLAVGWGGVRWGFGPHAVKNHCIWAFTFFFHLFAWSSIYLCVFHHCFSTTGLWCHSTYNLCECNCAKLLVCRWIRSQFRHQSRQIHHFVTAEKQFITVSSAGFLFTGLRWSQIYFLWPFSPFIACADFVSMQQNYILPLALVPSCSGPRTGWGSTVDWPGDRRHP